MQRFRQVTSVAAPLDMINIDTDMIIPKQHLKTIRRTGLGRVLFEELRYHDDGSDNADFVLNKPAYRKAEILITGENFGCGSSREHAPWALLDYGIRAIIAPSFADIFFNNCFKNGILPITLDHQTVARLMTEAGKGANATFTVDLEQMEIILPTGERISFAVEQFRRHCLLHGLDDIGLTLEQQDRIASFEQNRQITSPWLARAV